MLPVRSQHTPSAIPAQPWRCGPCCGIAQPGSCPRSVCARGAMPAVTHHCRGSLHFTEEGGLGRHVVCSRSIPAAHASSWSFAASRAPLPPAPRHRAIPGKIWLMGSCVILQTAEPSPVSPQVNTAAGDRATGTERGVPGLPVRVPGAAPLPPLPRAVPPRLPPPDLLQLIKLFKRSPCGLCPWHGEGMWPWHCLGENGARLGLGAGLGLVATRMKRRMSIPTCS